MITKNATRLNRKANQCRIMVYNPNGVYRVKSPSGKTYTVDLGMGGTCTCAWGQKGNAGCSHEMAARKHWARVHQERAVSFQAGNAGTVARKQHKATIPIAEQGTDAVTAVLRDRMSGANIVWNAPRPEIHSTGNLLLDTPDLRVYARWDGDGWKYSAHEPHGKFWPQVGYSFEREHWGMSLSRQEFDRWFEKVSVA